MAVFWLHSISPVRSQSTLYTLLLDYFWWGTLPYKNIMWCQLPLACYPPELHLAFLLPRRSLFVRLELPFPVSSMVWTPFLFCSCSFFPHPSCHLWQLISFDLSLSCSPEAIFLAFFFIRGVLPHKFTSYKFINSMFLLLFLFIKKFYSPKFVWRK